MIYHINKIKEIKDKNMIISVDTEQAFDKSQYPLMIKILNNLDIKETQFNILKVIHKKLSDEILVLNGERLEAFL